MININCIPAWDNLTLIIQRKNFYRKSNFLRHAGHWLTFWGFFSGGGLFSLLIKSNIFETQNNSCSFNYKLNLISPYSPYFTTNADSPLWQNIMCFLMMELQKISMRSGQWRKTPCSARPTHSWWRATWGKRLWLQKTRSRVGQHHYTSLFIHENTFFCAIW